MAGIRSIAVLVTAVAVSFDSFAQGQPPPYVEPGVAYASMELPPPIDQHDQEWYLRILGLEGDAHALAVHFFDEYREGVQALRDVEERALWEKAREVAAIQRQEEPWRQLREREGLMERRAEYLKKIDALENELFNDLAALLSLDNQHLILRLRQDRERAQAAEFLSTLAGSTDDLTRYIRAMRLTEEELLPLDTIVLSYEQAITPLVTRAVRDWIEVDLKAARLQTAVHFNDDGSQRDPADGEGRARWEQAYDIEIPRLLRERADALERAFRLNRQYYERFQAALPPEHAKAMARECLNRWFVNIHPDPEGERAAELAEEALAIEGLDGQLRQRVENALKTYREAHKAVQDDMEEIYIPWRTRMIYQRSANVYEREEVYAGPLVKLHAERRKLNFGLVEQIEAIIGADAIKVLRGWIHWEVQSKVYDKHEWRPG